MRNHVSKEFVVMQNLLKKNFQSTERTPINKKQTKYLETHFTK